jgi:hypothetical protein
MAAFSTSTKVEHVFKLKIAPRWVTVSQQPKCRPVYAMLRILKEDSEHSSKAGDRKRENAVYLFKILHFVLFRVFYNAPY